MVASEKNALLRQTYDKYYQRLCFYASKYINDFDAVEDTVQEVYIKLWEKDLHFENDYALSAYLYSSVYHACLNYLEQEGIHARHHRKILQNAEVEDSLNYVNERIENEVLWEVFHAVDDLPDECRKVFKLSYIEGHDLATVAEMLGISVNTVRSQRARGKKLLQERLKGLFPIAAFLFFS